MKKYIYFAFAILLVSIQGFSSSKPLSDIILYKPGVKVETVISADLKNETQAPSGSDELKAEVYYMYTDTVSPECYHVLVVVLQTVNGQESAISVGEADVGSCAGSDQSLINVVTKPTSPKDLDQLISDNPCVKSDLLIWAIDYTCSK